MHEKIDLKRRRLLGTAGIAVTASRLGFAGSAYAQPPASPAGSGPRKPVDAGVPVSY